MSFINTLGVDTSAIQSMEYSTIGANNTEAEHTQSMEQSTPDFQKQTTNQPDALYDLLLTIDPLNANLLYGLCKGSFFSLFLFKIIKIELFQKNDIRLIIFIY